MKKNVTSISKEEPGNYRLASHPHLDPWEGITRQGGVADTPDSHGATQRNLDRLEKSANRNLKKPNQGKCEILDPGRDNPRH